MYNYCMNYDAEREAEDLRKDWNENPRWKSIERRYTPEAVVALRGSVKELNVLATRGALKLWDLLNGRSKKGYVNSLGALTGGQALQMAKGGVEAIYLSGWQVAADNNSSLQMYPDQSLYSYDSVPRLIRAMNATFRRADQIQWSSRAFNKAAGCGDAAVAGGQSGSTKMDYFLPIVADAEAGFGGVLNAYELVRNMIEAGAAGIHLEDQLASAKKCGHLGGKVLVPTSEAIDKLVAARLAADVAGVPTVIVARTDAMGAGLLTSNVDERDRPFIVGDDSACNRTSEGFFRTEAGIEQAISRGLSYAPYADLIWCETSTPNLKDAAAFANAIHAKYPGKLLAYNCSPSFNWKANLTDEELVVFQDKLSDLGYKFQFITLAGIHSMWYNIFNLSHHYAKGAGMKHYVDLVQSPEFEAAKSLNYTFVRHQQEVGVGYFDSLQTIVTNGTSATLALEESTETAQFH